MHPYGHLIPDRPVQRVSHGTRGGNQFALQEVCCYLSGSKLLLVAFAGEAFRSVGHSSVILGRLHLMGLRATQFSSWRVPQLIA